MRSRAILGVWLGIELRTGENRVALMDGGPVIRVRTMIRVPDSVKWNAEQVAKLVAIPRQPNPRDKDQEDANNIRDTKGIDLGGDGSQLAETPVRQHEEGLRRDFRITADIFAKNRLHSGLCRMRDENPWHRSPQQFC